MKKLAPLLAVTALAACGGNGSNGGGGTGQQIKIVGSSTVYPFARAIAEEPALARWNCSATARVKG